MAALDALSQRARDRSHLPAASGLPRKANALAHHALFASAIQKAKSINTEHVQAAMQEVLSAHLRVATRPVRTCADAHVRAGLSLFGTAVTWRR